MNVDWLIHWDTAQRPSQAWLAVRYLCGLLLAFLASGAYAQSAAGDEAEWICWHTEGAFVNCRLGSAIAARHAGSGSRSSTADSAAEVPTGRRALPAIVRTILTEPRKLAGRTIQIPLLTDSGDRDFVHELAEAVMCGTKKACRVVFLDQPSDIALALDVLDDPALN